MRVVCGGGGVELVWEVHIRGNVVSRWQLIRDDVDAKLRRATKVLQEAQSRWEYYCGEHEYKKKRNYVGCYIFRYNFTEELIVEETSQQQTKNE